MKRMRQSPWMAGLVVLALTAIPVLAALSALRRQAVLAEKLLFDRSAEVVAGHLRLLTTRQAGWQNALRMRLCNRPPPAERLLDELLSPDSGMNRPANCSALGYGVVEDGRVVLAWQRGEGGRAFGEPVTIVAHDDTRAFQWHGFADQDLDPAERHVRCRE